MKEQANFNLFTEKKILGLFLGLFFFAPVGLWAQALPPLELTIDQKNLSVVGDIVLYPGKREIFLAPGETVVYDIRVSNRTDSDLAFTVSVEDLAPADNPDEVLKILPPNQSGPYPLRNFVQPAVDAFTLPAGAEATLPFAIIIPFDAPPGGLYGTILVAARPVGAGDDIGGTILYSRLGSHLLVRIAGEVTEDGGLAYFTTRPPKTFYFYRRPEQFELGFFNKGNVHLVPYGEVTIDNIFGRTIKRLPVNAFFVLPDSTRRYAVDWPADNLPAFGRYQATLSIYPGYGEESRTDSLVYWVFPWPLMVAGMIALLFIFIIWRFITGRFEFRRRDNYYDPTRFGQ